VPEEPTKTETQKVHPLDEAKMLLETQQYEPCLALLKQEWLKDINHVPTITMFAKLVAAGGRNELAQQIERLCASLESGKEDPQSLFEVGFGLIDLRQFDIASILLDKCAQLVPDEPTINYELAFALMSQRRYEDAIANFLRAWAAEEDFDTALNLTVSYICTRQISRAKDMLQSMIRLAGAPEHEREIGRQKLAIRRLEDLKDKSDLTARDWLFVHYGSVLLTQSNEPGNRGRFKAVWNDYKRVASTLLILRGVLEGLGVQFDVVEYYSPLSRPLARALSELLGIEAESYKGPQRDERALLVMAWASDIIGPHEAFVGHQSKRSIFAYGLSASESLPITPEVVACVTDSCAMPWDEHWKIEEYDDGRPSSVEHIVADERVEEVTQKILNESFKLEADADILHTVQDAVSYYRSREHFLVLNNSHLFTERPEYTAEVP